MGTKGWAIVGVAAAMVVFYFSWTMFLSPQARVERTLRAAAAAGEQVDAVTFLSFFDASYTDYVHADRATFVDRIEEAFERGEAQGGYSQALISAADLLVRRAQAIYVPAINIVMLYDDAGETEKALVWLERAWENRDPDMPYISAMTYSERIHNDPQFQEMLRRMSLPMD